MFPGLFAERPEAGNAMRVHVDLGVCESNGYCMGIDPEVFDLDDDDNLILLMPDVGPERAPRMHEAVRQCPRQAITVTES